MKHIRIEVYDSEEPSKRLAIEYELGYFEFLVQAYSNTQEFYDAILNVGAIRQRELDYLKSLWNEKKS